MACQSRWSSAINSGLALSSRAPRGGRVVRAVELELLLIYLKYWPDLPCWNISIRCWGKEMPEPAAAGKKRKQSCQMGPKSVIVSLRQWCWGRQVVVNDRKEWVQLGGGQGGSDQLTKSIKELSVRCSAPLGCDLIVFSGLEMSTARICTFSSVQW